MSDVYSALVKLDTSKAMGINKISSRILKECPSVLYRPIHHLLGARRHFREPWPQATHWCVCSLWLYESLCTWLISHSGPHATLLIQKKKILCYYQHHSIHLTHVYDFNVPYHHHKSSMWRAGMSTAIPEERSFSMILLNCSTLTELFNIGYIPELQRRIATSTVVDYSQIQMLKYCELSGVGPAETIAYYFYERYKILRLSHRHMNAFQN